jgi:hypothetical protein
MNTEATAQPREGNTDPKVVRAKQFVLEDANGKTRAVLDVDKEGVPGLYLYDDDGTPRVMLAVGTHGSVLAMFDRNGKNRVSVAVSGNVSSIRLSDGNNKPRIRVTVGSDGAPELELLHASGVQIWSKP